jgi:anti-sigma B factor antagonist
MRITSATVAGVTLLAVFGEVDLATADQLYEAGMKALADGAPVRIDLAGVTFMDSTGLAALVRIRNQAEDPGHLIVQNPRPNVARVFAVTALDKVFQIEGTESS